jgi:predicted small lipoprotein YifL
MVRTATLIVAAGLLLAACGVRGPLQTPKSDVAAPASNTATAESGQGKPADAAQKPHQGFILDGLLR